VPRKNLRVVGGKHLIAYAITTALDTEIVDFVAVSTEDEEIASVSRELGVKIIKRPDELASDEVSLPEVTKHAQSVLEAEGISPKRFISLQPTGPLITSNSLTGAIELHERTKCDSVASLVKITHTHPYWSKTFDPVTHRVGNFLNVDVHKYPQKQDVPPCYMYTGGFYIRKTELLKNSGEFYLGEDIRGYLLPHEETLDIDDEEDMEYFEYIISRKAQRV